ncbi:hypothetical protein [Streptomyces sp. NPDC056291]|uniref:hypothetical protein n=1 Tax=Streptomyces sp. NPDC056291 TaxID=3345772 RepID=UPI0035DFFB16
MYVAPVGEITNSRAQPPVARSNRRRVLGHPGVYFVIGMVFLALGTWWFLVPTVRDTIDLAHGVRAVAILREEPADCLEGCPVAFDAAGTSVVGRLPAHDLIKNFHEGSSVPIRYQPEHPQRIALEASIGLAPIIFTSIIPLLGLWMTVMSIRWWLRRVRTP